MAMRSRGTSSSSPTIWRMAMRPPVPMSTLPTKRVTEPSACTARNESTASGASDLPRKRSAPGTVWAGARMAPSSPSPTIRTPPAARKLRREMPSPAISPPSRGRGSGPQHCANHAGVAAAAAEVAGEGLPHLLLVRSGRPREEGARGHDHAGRAIAALRGLLGDEGGLERIGAVRGAEALDGDHVLTHHRARGGDARADRAPTHEHRAGAALGETAAEMSARQPQVIAQDVEEGNVRIIRLDLPASAVDPQRELRHACPPWAGHAIPEARSRGCVAETLPRVPGGRQGDRLPLLRSRLAEKVPEGQTDALPVNARLTGNAVDVVALTGPSHHEKGAVPQGELLPLPILFPPRLDDQSPRRAERHDRHQRVRAQLRLVIGVQPHAVLAAPIAVEENVVEGHARAGADIREQPARRLRERPRLERLPRVSVGEIAGPGDQARLQDVAPEQHDLPLLPSQLAAKAGQSVVGFLRRQPLRVVVEPGAGAEGNAHLDGGPRGAGERALTRSPKRPARTPGRSARPPARSPPRARRGRAG